MSSELKAIRRMCIEHGKKHQSCIGCKMFQEITFPDEKKEKAMFCILGVPVKWKIDLIRSWFTKDKTKTKEE
jgi:hypothetical protein